jgi:hypothetical protein
MHATPSNAVRLDAGLGSAIANMTRDPVRWIFILWMGHVVITGIVVLGLVILFRS